MDDSLLDAEAGREEAQSTNSQELIGSSSWGFNFRRLGRPSQGNEEEKKEESNSHENQIKEAAIHIGLAWQGQEGENTLFSPLNSTRSPKVHKWSKWLSRLASLSILVLVLLSFFSQPRWFFEEIKTGENLNMFPMWFADVHEVYLDSATVAIIEIFLLPIIVLDLCFKKYILQDRFWYSHYKGAAGKREEKANIYPYWIECIVVAVYVLIYGFNNFIMDGESREVVPFLRILIFITRRQRLGELWISTFKIIYAAKDVLLFQCIFVFLTAWFALCLFVGSPYTMEMGTTGEAYLDLAWGYFLLLSTVNSPDVMIAMYKESRPTVFLFMAYVVIGIFFLMDLILATIVEIFYMHNQAATRQEHKMQKEALQAAFEKLDPEKKRFVTFMTLQKLFLEMGNTGLLTKSSVQNFIKDTKQALHDFHDPVAGPAVTADHDDIENNHDFEAFEFSQASFEDCIGLIFASEYIRPRKTQIQKCCPRLYNSAAWQNLKYFVCEMRLPNRGIWSIFSRAKIFEIWVDAVVIINMGVLMANVIQCDGDEELNLDCFNVNWDRVIFVILYDMELILKISCYGWWRYWGSPINRFDFINILLYNLVLFPYAIVIWENTTDRSFAVIGVVHVILLFRIFRVFYSVEQCRNYVKRFFSIASKLGTLLLLVFTYIYVMDCFGVIFFGGSICSGVEAEEYDCYLDPSTSDYGADDYYALNFNDMFSGFVTVFVLLLQNNWNVFADAFTVVQGTNFARMYFVLNYLFGVIVILNVVIAFVITTVMTSKKYFRKQKLLERMSKDPDFCPSEMELDEITITVEGLESSGSSTRLLQPTTFILEWAANPREEEYQNFDELTGRIYDQIKNHGFLEQQYLPDS